MKHRIDVASRHHDDRILHRRKLAGKHRRETDGRTRLVSTSLFYTVEERDGMLSSGMEGGVNESYVALDKLLATLD